MEQLHRGQERLLGGGLRDELLEGLLGCVGGERASHREVGGGSLGKAPSEFSVWKGDVTTALSQGRG